MDGPSQRKDQRKGTLMNPPFGSVRLLGKFRPLINFFRIEEIDALHVRPQGEGQGCPESNSLRLDRGRCSPEFSCTRSPGSEGD